MDPGVDMSLEDLQAYNLDCVGLLREEKIVAGFLFNGHTYQSDEVSRNNISGAATLALALMSQGQDFPPSFTWRTVDNIDVPMNAVAIIGLGTALFQYVSACYFVSFTHKANITVMTDIPTLIGYDITTGWPA